MIIIKIEKVEDVLSLYPEADEERLSKIREDVSQDIIKSRLGERIIYGFKELGKVAGTVQLVFSHDKKYYADGNNLAHITHARVMEDMRSRGVGAKLMKEAEDEARARGFIEITLGVDEDNLRAIKFYKKLGYKEFMQETGDYGEIIIGMKKYL